MVKKSVVSIRFHTDLMDGIPYTFTLLNPGEYRMIYIPGKNAMIVYKAHLSVMPADQVCDLVLPYRRFVRELKGQIPLKHRWRKPYPITMTLLREGGELRIVMWKAHKKR